MEILPVPFHFMINFEPVPGREDAFREEALRVIEPTRAEPGCLRIDLFESVRFPPVFAIHSEWVDEAAFDLHTSLPHTVQFLEAAARLSRNAIKGLRLHRVGG